MFLQSECQKPTIPANNHYITGIIFISSSKFVMPTILSSRVLRPSNRTERTGMTALNTPSSTTHPLLWPVMAVLLVIGWSSGFVGIRFANAEASVFLLLFWRTLLSGLILLPFALFLGPRLGLRAIGFQMAFGVLSVFLYLGGFALAIEQRVPTGLVALISDLLPLAIAALSQPVLGERLSGRQWGGTAIAVSGVMIVSFHSLTFGSAPLWA